MLSLRRLSQQTASTTGSQLSVRYHSHWSGSHRWNDGLKGKGAGQLKRQQAKQAQATDVKEALSSNGKVEPQASTSAVKLDSPTEAPTPAKKPAVTLPQARKPHLPTVPLLGASPNVIARDALYSQHRPLLEVQIPENKRKSVSSTKAVPAESRNKFLEEILGALPTASIESQHIGPVDVKNSSAAKYIAGRTAFLPPAAPSPAGPAPSTEEQNLAFLSPFTNQNPYKLRPPASASFLASQFHNYLSRAHSKLNADEQQALDAFFHSNEPLSTVLEKHVSTTSKEDKQMKDEGFAAALEAAKQFISLLPSMTENESSKAYRMFKKGEEWVAEEMDVLAPGSQSQQAAGAEMQAMAYVEQLPEGSELEEGVEILDLTDASAQMQGGKHISSILGLLQKAFVKPGSESEHEIRLKRANDMAKLMLEESGVIIDDGNSRRCTGRRISLGPRILARRGPRTVRMVIRLDSVKRKRKTKMTKHKFKKRRKAQKAMRRRQGK